MIYGLITGAAILIIAFTHRLIPFYYVFLGGIICSVIVAITRLRKKVAVTAASGTSSTGGTIGSTSPPTATPLTFPSPSPTPTPTPVAYKNYGWVWPVILGILAIVVVIWVIVPMITKTSVTPLEKFQKPTTPQPQYHKNTPLVEQEISISAVSESYRSEQIDNNTLRIKKGGRVKYKFCIKESRSPSEIWMLNFSMYAENTSPGRNGDTIILQINGTSQEKRMVIGWVPDDQKNAPGNILINPGATIGGCENEFSLDALTGPIIIKGPIKIIRRF